MLFSGQQLDNALMVTCGISIGTVNSSQYLLVITKHLEQHVLKGFQAFNRLIDAGVLVDIAGFMIL